MKRNRRSSFMANAFVYPGGRVDEADGDDRLVDFVDGLTPTGASEALFGRTGPELAFALYMTALRECFEEAGVLPAIHADGQPLTFDDPSVAARFAAHREALHAGEMTLLELVTDERLRLDASGMQFFAHWITPIIEQKRFDTRFFVIRAPAGQEPLHDNKELVESTWLTPDAALESYTEGAIQLAPPTWRTLGWMRQRADVDDLLTWARNETPVPILPVFGEAGGEMALFLPGDPEHPSDEPTRPPHRIVLRDGRWAHVDTR